LGKSNLSRRTEAHIGSDRAEIFRGYRIGHEGIGMIEDAPLETLDEKFSEKFFYQKKRGYI
jgi:hypothetical protein